MSAKPKIGLMTYAIDGRRAKGTALVAEKYVEALLWARDEFELVFLHFEPSREDIYTHGVREIIFPKFRWNFLNHRFPRMIYFFLTTKERFDIVHWFQPRLYPFFWLVPAKHIFVTVHEAGDIVAPNFFNFSRIVFGRTLRWFHKKVTAAIVVSRFAKEEVVQHYRFNPEQVVPIYDGVDPSFTPRTGGEIEVVKKKYGIASPFFLNIGRLQPHKNVPRLIRNFRHFLDTPEGKDFHLVNVGDKGHDREEVLRLLEDPKLKERVRLVEYVDVPDLPVLYSAAFALVYPSLHEGFGLPIIESFACGTPVVTSNTTCLPEISAGAALVVDPADEQAIAAGMRRIAADAELRASLKEKGFARAHDFSWEKTAEELLRLYRRYT